MSGSEANEMQLILAFVVLVAGGIFCGVPIAWAARAEMSEWLIFPFAGCALIGFAIAGHLMR